MPLNREIQQDQAAALWLASLRAMGRSSKTTDIYGYATGQLHEWRASRDTGLETLTKLEALAFTNHLLERYEPGGVQTRIKALRAFYNFLVAEEMATLNPFARVQVTVPDEDQPVVSEEQITAMLASAKKSRHRQRDVALITVLVDTGCRKGELAGVLVEDVDLGSGTIRFRESKTKPRTVPLTDRAVVALGRWLRARGTASGSLWAVQDPYGLVKSVCLRNSNGAVTPHQARRAFAIRWLERGGSESGLMRVAGWSSSEMVRLYTRSAASRLASDEMRRLMG